MIFKRIPEPYLIAEIGVNHNGSIEIAKKLIEKEGFSREKAIKKAVVMAEEWFYDLEG